MRRYIDLDDLILRKRITGDPLCSELVKRGLTIPYQLQFVRNGAVVEPDATGGALTATLGLKEKGKYDATAYIISSSGVTKTGTGVNAVYELDPLFSSPALDVLFNKNSSPDDDLDQVALMAEIQFSYVAGTFETVNAFEFLINNNLIRGGESSTSYPVTGQIVYLPNITRLIGGNIDTDLDGQYLAGYPSKTEFDVTIDIGGGVLSSQRYRKISGSTPSGSGWILTIDNTQLVRVGG